MAIIVDSPIAESIEYRPPTQSQNPNMLAVIDAEGGDVLRVRRDGDEVPAPPRAGLRRRPASSQSRALIAFVIVSSVVNVFEETMKRVSAGSRSRVASRKSAPSMFDTNRNVSARSL